MKSSLPYGGASRIGNGLRFACQGCGACCSGPDGFVFITDEEAAAMARSLDLAVEDFRQRFTRRAHERLALIDNERGDCFFLQAGRCRVYDARPYQCRSFPFWFSNLRSAERWEEVSRGCPGIGRGRLHRAEEIIRWLDGSPFLKSK